MKISFWKMLGFFGAISLWAETSLCPDDDGKVRITIEELTSLAQTMCDTFGWEAEIVVK